MCFFKSNSEQPDRVASWGALLHLLFDVRAGDHVQKALLAAGAESIAGFANPIPKATYEDEVKTLASTISELDEPVKLIQTARFRAAWLKSSEAFAISAQRGIASNVAADVLLDPALPEVTQASLRAAWKRRYDLI